MPYYIEDTNIVSSAVEGDDLGAPAKPGTNRAQLEEKRRELERDGYKPAITPLLISEIIIGLANGPSGKSGLDDFVNFHKTVNKLRLLYPWDRPVPEMISAPQAFAMRAALGLRSPTELRQGPDDFKHWVNIIFHAQGPEEVWHHGALIQGVRHKLDRLQVLGHRDKMLATHRQIMQAARDNKLETLSPAKFARQLLTSEGFVLPRAEEIHKVQLATEAAYHHHLWLHRQARSGNYNFQAKHKSDPIDFSFLLYLAEPGLLFLTHDSRLKDRIGNCRQRDQIIVLSNLEKTRAKSVKA